MITQVAVYRGDPDIDLGSAGQGIDRLISSLFGTTEASREDPGVDVYLSRLEAMDTSGLQYEATGFARAMHDTGSRLPVPRGAAALPAHRERRPGRRGPRAVRHRPELPAALPQAGAPARRGGRAPADLAVHLRPGPAAGPRDPLRAAGRPRTVAPAHAAAVGVRAGAADAGVRSGARPGGPSAGRGAVDAGPAARHRAGRQPDLPVGAGAVHVGLQRPRLPVADGGLGRARRRDRHALRGPADLVERERRRRGDGTSRRPGPGLPACGAAPGPDLRGDGPSLRRPAR